MMAAAVTLSQDIGEAGLRGFGCQPGHLLPPYQAGP